MQKSGGQLKKPSGLSFYVEGKKISAGDGDDLDYRGLLLKKAQAMVHTHGGEKNKVSLTGCGMGTFTRRAGDGWTSDLEIHGHGERVGTSDGGSHYKGGLSYVGLAHCGNVWACPVCAPRVGAVRLKEIIQAATYLLKQNQSYIFGTFTARHTKDTRLLDSASRFKKAKRLLSGHRLFKQVKKKFGRSFEITAFEVTCDAPWVVEAARTGWHFHCHCMIFFDRYWLSESECLEVQRLLALAWQECCAKVGLEASLERGFYLESIQSYAKKTGLKTPFDKLPEVEQKKYIERISKYFIKSMGLELTGASRKTAKKAGKYGGGRCTTWALLIAAVEGDDWARDKWLEFFFAMRGVKEGGSGFHFVQFSRGLKKVAGISEKKEDDQEAIKGESGELIYTFENDSWLSVARQGRMWTLLRHVKSAEFQAVSVPEIVNKVCSAAASGIDVLTGEDIGVNRSNPVWYGCEKCPPFRVGGAFASDCQAMWEAEEEREKQHQARLALFRLDQWRKTVESAVNRCDWEWICKNLDSFLYARSYLKGHGRGSDADRFLPLAMPWAGCGDRPQFLLPGLVRKKVRVWVEKGKCGRYEEQYKVMGDRAA